MIIDGHTHVFLQDTTRYPLANPEGGYRPQADGSARALRAEMLAAGVDRALTITAGFYGWDNSSTLDELAGNSGWLAGAALVDPASTDGPDDLEALVQRGICGIRIQRHLFYHQSLDDPISTPLWARAGDLDLTIDVNASLPEYGAVENRVREFPNTRFVLDHCGYIGHQNPSENTVDAVVALARYPNVYAKLSFLPSASAQSYPFGDVHWMVRDIVNAYGPERCLFGTNFPQAQYSPNETYGQLVDLFREDLPLSAEERQWILGGTAAGLWRWTDSD